MKISNLFLLLSLLLITACSVDTPLTLAQKWLEAWRTSNTEYLVAHTITKKNNGYEPVTTELLTTQQQYYQQQLEEKTIEMTHMVALTDSELKEKQAEAGFWIFYDLIGPKLSKTNKMLLMVQHEGKWKAVLTRL